MAYCIYLRKSRADRELENQGHGDTLKRHRDTLIELAKKKHLVIEGGGFRGQYFRKTSNATFTERCIRR